MQLGAGGRRKTRRRGQPVMPKRRDVVEEHPFRKTTSGFESLIPRAGSEDFFFSQLLKDPEHAAEFFEQGDDREPLLGDPRVGIGVSAVVHVLLVLFLLFDPSLGRKMDPSEQQDLVAETEREPLVLFMEEQPPPVAAVPVVPVVPVQPVPAPDAAPQAPTPPPPNNSLILPRAMIEPERRAQVMDDLPYSTGNSEEFYTDEEVKDPGTEGETAKPLDEAEPDPLVAEETGDDALDVDAQEGAETGADAPEVADDRVNARELGDLLLRDSMKDSVEDIKRRDQQRRRIDVPDPRVQQAEIGEGGENGTFTDIRRFLAGSRFHHPEGGLVIAGRDNTLYYNDKGANFVPWLNRMLAEVRRTWIASMPYAANVYAGHTAVGFTVARDGSVIALETLVRSGVPGFDNNAEGAVRSARLLPLPADYPDETFDIVIVFWVNERPYDIFG